MPAQRYLLNASALLPSIFHHAPASPAPSPPPTPATHLSPLQIAALIVPIVAAIFLLVFGVNNLPDLWKKIRHRWESRIDAAVEAAKDNVIIDTLPGPADLVNRIIEVETVRKALAGKDSLISIAGPTGIGKSAIAVAAAALYRDTAIQETGKRKNTIWADVHDSCPTLEELARLLSLSFSQPGISAAPSRDKELVIRRFLADHPTILVIDNLAPPQNVAQRTVLELLESLPTGSCAVLSWGESMTAKGKLIQVQDLSVDHAEDLLLREAERHGVLLCSPENVHNTVSRIFERFGGNPQGLRWLVLEMKNSARNVDEALERLTSRGSHIYAELFGNIWETIGESRQNVLTAVADARLPVSREYLSAATSLAALELHETIDALFLMGVLERTDDHNVPHVRLPNITRSYVMSHADVRRVSAMRRRLTKYYIRRLEADWEDAAGVESNIENIIQIFHNAKTDGDCRAVLKLFALILDILFTLGLFDDRITLGHVAVDCARRVNQPVDEALAWSVIASTHTVRAEYRLADEALRQGRAAADASGSAQAIAYQARCRAYNFYREARIAEARKELEGLLDRLDQAGDPNGAIDVVALQSSLALYEGRRDEAQAAIDDFNGRILAAGWRRAEAYPAQEYAELALWKRNMDQAHTWITQAESVATQYRDRRQLIRIALTAGRIHLFGGDHRAATSRLTTAAAEARSYGLANELAEILAHLELARRRPRWFWEWVNRLRAVPHRLAAMPIGGD
jgi:hypothetical protein